MWGNYSREKTIQGQKLYEEIRYDKSHLLFWIKCLILRILVCICHSLLIIGSSISINFWICEVGIILEQNFSTAHPKKSNVDSILLGDKNATSLSFSIVSTLILNCFVSGWSLGLCTSWTLHNFMWLYFFRIFRNWKSSSCGGNRRLCLCLRF